MRIEPTSLNSSRSQHWSGWPGSRPTRRHRDPASSRAAISKSRRSSVIPAFSVAAALLLGAVIAWAAAGIGGPPPGRRSDATMDARASPRFVTNGGPLSSWKRRKLMGNLGNAYR